MATGEGDQMADDNELTPEQQIIESIKERELVRKRLVPLAQLAIWEEDQRAIPNELVRCALFSARNRKAARVMYKDQEITMVSGGHVQYTGEELRQIDLTVWLQMVHLARNTQLGNTVRFKAYGFCKAIGWGTSRDNYRRLRDCLTRMQATSLKVYSSRIRLGNAISMIPSFSWKDDASDESLTEYEVTLSPKLVDLFGDVYFTKIEWEQRLALPDGLATWLQGYFASHRNPHPISIESIRDHCGSDTKSLPSFTQKVKIALQLLVDVGFLKSWNVASGLVYVTRS